LKSDVFVFELFQQDGAGALFFPDRSGPLTAVQALRPRNESSPTDAATMPPRFALKFPHPLPL
jgi:hypothetical protein